MARPNVILILAAQHRWDCVGYAGNPDVRTPNLDALATHGVNFAQAITAYPLCVPARCTLLTGQYASSHGVRDDLHGLPEGGITLPRLLHEAGYKTACIGKMHFKPTYANYGFDVMRLAEQVGDGRCEDDYHKWLDEQGATDKLLRTSNLELRTFGAIPSNLPEAQHSTTWVGSAALRFVQTAREPFFLMIGFIKPHHPFDPPAPWHKLYKPKALTLPGGWCLPVPEEDARHGGFFDPHAMTETKFRRVLAYYYASISHLDHQIGRLLATLTARGFTNNLFIYCADHGDYMGQHGLITRNFEPRTSNFPMYDSLLRVPLLIAGLAGQRRGKTDAALAQLTDVMPTVLDAVGLDIPDAVDGKGLVPQLRRAKHGSDSSRYLTPLRTEAFCEGPADIRIVRGRRYKLVESADEDRRAFYDLRKDPHEFDNLYGQSKMVEKQAELTRALELIGTRAARKQAKPRPQTGKGAP